ncbi:MAG: hypothetical protein HGA44_20805 [Cellulomonadaceae bacterium]|nr:hypothetical protein [Cellulomonadaceae bacterium]
MSAELHAALSEIAAAAGDGVPTVDLGRVRGRVRRRRAGRAAVGTSATLVAVAGVVVVVILGAGRTPTPAAPLDTPSASSSPTEDPTAALPGWVPGAAPCGTTPALVESDGAGVKLEGEIVPGTLDLVTAEFAPGPEGTSVFDDVTVAAEVLGVPSNSGGVAVVMLLDPSGAVAFWNDEDRLLPQITSTVDSHFSSLSRLYPAVDCRTGRPLVGTYRTFATVGDEAVMLTPVTFGAG